MLKPDSDQWAEWLLRGRNAGDPAYARKVYAATEAFADRVLDGAQPGPGMTLVDVGAGDGLVAFRAIERVGRSLRVILADVSAPLLAHAERSAARRGVLEQCSFLQCDATALTAIPDASVDVVTTRAVLAYVSDKNAALREFHRVLKPGGILSIAEPVFQDEALAALALRKALAAPTAQAKDRFMSLLHRWKSAQFPDTEAAIEASPIANYSERDLLRFVQEAGFTRLHMELHIDVLPSDFPSWEVFIGVSPHPWAPPLGFILENQFSAEERRFFESILRPNVLSGQAGAASRNVYVTARKPD